ncbi:MAG: ATP phosphoribosyltransferase regulatory subunit, partial [Clostridia bacterium]|nr:ATP phosphoribosyltransferase regulatory subunit [Clostridia bacterium]
VASTKLNDEDLPAKLFYFGKCFRAGESNGGKMREFTQSGAEIIGSANTFYDALMIATAVEAVKAIGIDEFIIELGQVDFFRGLMDLAALGEEDSEKMRVLIDSKDFFGVEEMLVGRSIENEVRNLLLNLPSYYGKKEMLLEVRGMTSDKRLLDALDQLSELMEILEAFGVSEYISVDLGMVKRLDYYTGFIFRGMTYGMGFPILGGGRYDTLCGKFGKPMPATGFSLGVDRALTAIYRNKGETGDGYPADSIVCFENGSMQEAMAVAKALKKQGLRIEVSPLEKEIDDLKTNAAAKGIKGMIFVKNNGLIDIIDMESNTLETTDMKTLVGGAS